MKTEDMKLIIAIIAILVYIVDGESKSPGDILDATFEEIRNNFTTMQSLNDALTTKYQQLEIEVKTLKVTCGPCAPCLEVKSQRTTFCDCTNFDAKKDCLDFFEDGIKVNGIYKLEAARFSTISAYCDQTTQGGGWTVIQRRKDGSVDFDRTWNDYRNGFGKLTGEFWFGNENIHHLTKSSDNPKKSQLLINMKIHGTNKKEYLRYSSFEILDEKSKYKLALSGYSGTMSRDTMAYSNNQKFSTKDEDNDQSLGHCATTFSGGWWYNHCFECNLNGVYSFKKSDKGLYYRYQTIQPNFVEMKIRRNK